MREIHKYINEFVYLFLFLNLILYWLNHAKNTNPLKWLTYYISLSFVIQLGARYLANIKEPNLYLLHYFTFFELILISFFYKSILEKEAFFQKWIIYLIGISGLIIAGNSYFLQPLDKFNSNAKTLTQIIFITYAIIYYFSILNKRTTPNPIIKLLNAAILLYYAGSFFIFMFSNVLLTNLEKDTQLLFWIFNSLLYLVFLLMVFIAGWQNFRKHKK